MLISNVVLSHSLSSVLSRSLSSFLVQSDKMSTTLTPSRLVLVTHLVQSDKMSMTLALSRLVHTVPSFGGYGGGLRWLV
jgi:hypothetical protein